MVSVLSVSLLYGGIDSLLSVERAVAGVTNSPLVLSAVEPQKQEIFPGGTADFTITVTNTGAVLLDTVSVTNSPFGDCNRDGLGPLSPGSSVSYDCTATGIAESTLNAIQATGGVSGGAPVTHGSNGYVKVLKQELSILKLPQDQTVTAGGTAAFNVIIKNISGTVLVDVRVDDSVANECDKGQNIPIFLSPEAELKYTCTLSNVQAPQTSILSVTGTVLVDQTEVRASDASWVQALKLQATLTPLPSSVPEPGELVSYVVNLVNTGSKELTMVNLNTDKYGNILDSNNPVIDPAQNTCLTGSTPPKLPPSGGTFTCSFVAQVTGQPSNYNVNLTATAKDKNDKVVTATAVGTVVITNLPASLNLSLSADPPFINPPSRPVTYEIQVQNTSEADNLTITKLEDQFLGDLDGEGSCETPVANLGPGVTYTCEFTAVVSGSVGMEVSREISVTAVDDDLSPNTVFSSKVIKVGVTAMPPQAVFFPNVTEDTVEPNKTCGQAYPLVLNRSYSFLPPAIYPSDQDYFTFELKQAARVKVELTNFLPQAGQILIRSDGENEEGEFVPCLNIEGKNGSTAVNKTVDLALKPAGKYYIQIVNDNGAVFTDMYKVIVRTY
jgi:hypothetical protein